MPVYFMVILVVIANVLPNETYPAVPSFPTQNPFTAAAPLNLLAFVPNNSDAAAAVMDYVASVAPFAGLGVQGFATVADLETYYHDNLATYLAGVVFAVEADGSLPVTPQVTLRYNGTQVPSTLTLNGDPSVCRGPSTMAGCPAQQYISAAFPALQLAVAEGLARVTLNASITAPPNETSWLVQQFPLPAYLEKSTTLASLVAIYTVVAFSPFVQFLVVNIVYEKEHRIKVHLLISGVSEAAYLLAWFVVYGVVVLFAAIIVAILAVPGHILPNSDYFLMFLLFFLFGLTMIAFGFAIAPFFSSSKVAGVVASLVTVLASILYLPLTLTPNPSGAAMWAVSLLSPVALSLAMGEAVAWEAAGQGATFDNLWTSFGNNGYSIGASLVMLVVDLVLYTFLAWYFDNVIPTEYGVRRPPYFLFLPSYWTGSARRRAPAAGSATTAAVSDPNKAANPDVETAPADWRVAIDIQ